MGTNPNELERRAQMEMTTPGGCYTNGHGVECFGLYGVIQNMKPIGDGEACCELTIAMLGGTSVIRCNVPTAVLAQRRDEQGACYYYCGAQVCLNIEPWPAWPAAETPPAV